MIDHPNTDPPPPVAVAADPAARDAPTVLEYGTETKSDRLNKPLNPRLLTAIVGVLTAVLAGGASAGGVPFVVVVAFSAVLAWMTYVTLRGQAEWDVPGVVVTQLVLAATLFAGAGLMICIRTGEANHSWGDSTYLWTHNQGYRYGPQYALRPWPCVAAGLLWFVVVATISVRPRRRRHALPAPPQSE